MGILAILFIIFIGFIVFELLKEALIFLVKVIAGILAVIVAVGLIIFFWPISGYILLTIAICFAIYKIFSSVIRAIKTRTERRNQRKAIGEWLSAKSKLYTENYLSELILNEIQELQEYFSYSEIYGIQNIPYGRASAFLTAFGRNIGSEQPLFLGVRRQSDYKELKEYGCLFTTRGIYIVDKLLGNQCILFEKLYNVEYKVSNTVVFTFTYVDTDNLCFTYSKIDLSRSFFSESEGACIYHVAHRIIETDANRSLFKNSIIDGAQYNNILESILADKMTYTDISQLYDLAECSQKIFSYGQTLEFQKKELKNYLNARQGHGYGAEYANTVVDRLLGKKVFNAAQNLDEHGRQVKDGADRMVDGVAIQTKYCDKPQTFLQSILNGDELRYLNSDGSPMMIEIPRDKYEGVVNALQRRIDNNEIKNITPGTDAKLYVKKGHVTYDQAIMVTKAGTLPSLLADAANGIVLGENSAMTSFITYYVLAIWQGSDSKEAFKGAFSSSMNGLKHSVIVNVVIMQLSRKEISFLANSFIGKGKGIFEGENPVYKMSEYIADKIQCSALAQTDIGKSLGLDDLKGYQVFGSIVTITAIYGPDVLKMIEGKISGRQLFKNAAITTAGLVASKFVVKAAVALLDVESGGFASAAIGVVSGMLGSYTAKKVLDQYIADDAVQMFIVLKEEFIDIIMQIQLTDAELDFVVKSTIGHEDIAEILEQMYASGDERAYAHDLVLCAVVCILSLREKITYSRIVKDAVSTLCEYVQEFCKLYNIEDERIFNTAYITQELLQTFDV